jgi:hypothetical protein
MADSPLASPRTPSGRPKDTRNFAQTIQAQTNDGDELVRFMLRVFRGKLDGAKVRIEDRMTAATWLADRGFGKPSQVQQLQLLSHGSGLMSLNEINQSAAEFRRRIADLVARHETSATEMMSLTAGTSRVAFPPAGRPSGGEA